MGRSFLRNEHFLLSVIFACSSAWINDWDKPFSFECPEHSFISQIYSVHDNWFEDRRFEIGCRNYTTKLEKCRWSEAANKFNQPLIFQCSGGEIITGMRSNHSDIQEDRSYQFKCCQVKGVLTYNCEFTQVLNSFNEEMAYTVPPGQVLRGVISYHDNKTQLSPRFFRTCINVK
ncbi:hypothetical protein FSP39_000866 [Pinctada imbricata]|uniref:Uncharacterized protein n=1 Tax=Pinctada imbricata TaxID=66713 RepID=A0AA89BW18_PINIB|nr:hypothetical protein FSP39_000866 [Pinctada imbricata]